MRVMRILRKYKNNWKELILPTDRDWIDPSALLLALKVRKEGPIDQSAYVARERLVRDIGRLPLKGPKGL